MDWPKVVVERHDGVLIARLTDQNNERSGPTSGLEATLSELETNHDLACGVLLVDPRSRLSVPGTRTRDQFDRVRADRIIDSRHRGKPVIAAAEGTVLNGGFHAVLACDLVVASTATSFGFSGHDPDSVEDRVRMLTVGRGLPPNVIRELLLTERLLDATRAEQFGFVNRVTEPGQVRAAALTMAGEIVRRAGGGPSALGPYRRQWLSVQANAFLGRSQT